MPTLMRSLADVVALESRVPDPTVGLPDNSYETIQRGAAIDPTAPALSFFTDVDHHATPARWTYEELLADITRAARLLHRLGVRRGDVVAYVLPNLPETHLVFWGAETTGTAFAVNALLDSGQVAELLKAASARWVVTTSPESDAEMWNRVAGAVPAVQSLQGILAVDALRHAPGRLAARPLPDAVAGVPVLDFHAEMAGEPGDSLGFEPPRPEDIASCFCTGGTTGLPKIAQHTHRNETANMAQLVAITGGRMFGKGKTVLTGLPLFHCNAMLGTGLSVFSVGGHVLLAPAAGYRAPGLIERFWEVVEQHRVSAFSGVPTIYAALLQAPREGRDLSSLDRAICGAAPMPVELFRKFEQETGLRILEGYGLTESSCVAAINPPDGETRIGSIGLRLPWERMEAVILDESGRFKRMADTDEVGVIALHGPNVIPGYLNPAQNEGLWIDVPGDDGTGVRWLNTGDLGRRDADGYFWLTGRKKELIIRGGHNIDPKTIEEALAQHPAVAIAAAVGRPDAHAGEIPVAYVQLRPGAKASEVELQRYAAEHISERAAIPRTVHLVVALPVTAVGKIFKPTLNMQEIESVVRAEAAAAGVELDALVVEQDPKHGIVARYRLAPCEADARQAFESAIGRYTFRSEVA